MIRKSCFRRLAFLLFAGGALVSFGAGCLYGTCTAQGCDDGLYITFAPSLDLTQDTTVEIEDLSAPTPRRLTCASVSRAEGPVMECNSNFATVSEIGIQILGTDVSRIRIVISRNGTQVLDRVLEPTYVGEEVWGEGCGVCTQATVTLDVP